MPTLLEELKRRNVFRVALAYIVVGWVVMQVAEFLSPLLRLPEWTVSMALYIGILGFPFAMLFTWAFELTPEGLKRSADVHPDDSISHETAVWLNRLVIGLMALAIVGLLADRYLSERPRQSSASPHSEISGELSTAVDRAADVAAEPEKAKSIAVLPFVNMSNDPEQEYFSDGISEELLNALAKIRELRVAARTSSFAFKGKSLDITEIGGQLKVETVLEGSVRKSGQRLRITAQLINVGDGYHLWSETYDRDITDIFEIQDEISAAIVDALRVHLDVGETSAESKVVDINAYNFYLLARHNLRLRNEASLSLAVQQYQQAIDIDPGYAAAWAGKALATDLLSDRNYGNVPKTQALQQARMMLDMAFSLDPDLGLAHAVEALLRQETYRPEASLTSLELAIESNPSEGILYAWKSNALGETGRYEQAFQTLKAAFELDPLHPVVKNNLMGFYVNSGEDEAARSLASPGSSLAYRIEAGIAGRKGQYARQVQAFEKSREVEKGGEGQASPIGLSFGYFFDLKNPEMAQRNTPDSLRLYYQSILDPAEAYARLQQWPDAGQLNSSLSALVLSQIKLERCEEALISLKRKAYSEEKLHGVPGFRISDIWLAYMQAYCQQQLGEEEKAQALAQRILQYLELAVANGEPPHYFRLLAAVQLLMGREDAAMQSMTEAWNNYSLSWVDLSQPWFVPLHGRDEFKALKESMQTHLNAERAKLGWEPVDI
jgi:TolB-like protein